MNKVINLHDVHDKQWMNQLLIYLKRRYTLISATELESHIYNEQHLTNFCHITVDDGDRTFYDVVYPLLKQHNIPATLFVSPKIILDQGNFWFQEIKCYDELKLKNALSTYLGVKLNMLTPYNLMHIFKTLNLSQIKGIIAYYKTQVNQPDVERHNLNINQIHEIATDSLISIGAHTLNHPVLSNEDNKSSEEEIVGSINGLSEILGYNVKYFAYPNGIPELDFGAREKEILKGAGCRLAFSTAHFGVGANCDPMSVPRYYVSKGTIDSIKLKLFLGPYWQYFRGLRTKSEETARAELRKILVTV
ncbi:MAG TPA: polysaccharide deacetylase family protein [Desulfobacteraceae bacterium]|nr:polysaccharide deacetylase family protein [Desulfobacteraceae bacterium]HPQ27433.1 polysaccharide deacetylase family protein [Desulfobacteraceae bacterium]